MAFSGSLAPCFVSNYADSRDHLQHYAGASRGTCLVSLCAVHIYELHPKKAGSLQLGHGCVHWVSHGRRAYSMSTATAAVPARREVTCGHLVLCLLLWLPHQQDENKLSSNSSSSLLPAS